MVGGALVVRFWRWRCQLRAGGGPRLAPSERCGRKPSRNTVQMTTGDWAAGDGIQLEPRLHVVWKCTVAPETRPPSERRRREICNTKQDR